MEWLASMQPPPLVHVYTLTRPKRMSQITDDHDYLMDRNTLWLGLPKNTHPSPYKSALSVYFSWGKISFVLV